MADVSRNEFRKRLESQKSDKLPTPEIYDQTVRKNSVEVLTAEKEAKEDRVKGRLKIWDWEINFFNRSKHFYVRRKSAALYRDTVVKKQKPNPVDNKKPVGKEKKTKKNSGKVSEVEVKDKQEVPKVTKVSQAKRSEHEKVSTEPKAAAKEKITSDSKLHQKEGSEKSLLASTEEKQQKQQLEPITEPTVEKTEVIEIKDIERDTVDPENMLNEASKVGDTMERRQKTGAEKEEVKVKLDYSEEISGSTSDAKDDFSSYVAMLKKERSITVANASCYGKSFVDFCTALGKSHNVCSRLKFKNCKLLSDDNVIELFKALRSKCSVTELGFEASDLSPKASKAISEYNREKKGKAGCVSSLGFVSCETLTDEDFAEILSSLENNEQINSLEVTQCELGDKSVNATVGLLNNNKTITNLTLRENCLSGEQVLQIAISLRTNSTVQRVCFDGNVTLKHDAQKVEEILGDHPTLSSVSVKVFDHHADVQKELELLRLAIFSEKTVQLYKFNLLFFGPSDSEKLLKELFDCDVGASVTQNEKHLGSMPMYEHLWDPSVARGWTLVNNKKSIFCDFASSCCKVLKYPHGKSSLVLQAESEKAEEKYLHKLNTVLVEHPIESTTLGEEHWNRNEGVCLDTKELLEQAQTNVTSSLKENINEIKKFKINNSEISRQVFNIWNMEQVVRERDLFYFWFTGNFIALLTFDLLDLVRKVSAEDEKAPSVFMQLEEACQLFSSVVKPKALVLLGFNYGKVKSLATTKEDLSVLLNHANIQLNRLLQGLGVKTLIMFHKNLSFFPVDLSTPEEISKTRTELRSDLSDLVTGRAKSVVLNKTFVRPISLLWVAFMESLERKIEVDNKKMIDVKEVYNLAFEYGIVRSEVEECLKTYHQLGTVLYLKLEIKDKTDFLFLDRSYFIETFSELKKKLVDLHKERLSNSGESQVTGEKVFVTRAHDENLTNRAYLEKSHLFSTIWIGRSETEKDYLFALLFKFYLVSCVESSDLGKILSETSKEPFFVIFPSLSTDFSELSVMPEHFEFGLKSLRDLPNGFLERFTCILYQQLDRFNLFRRPKFMLHQATISTFNNEEKYTVCLVKRGNSVDVSISFDVSYMFPLLLDIFCAVMEKVRTSSSFYTVECNCFVYSEWTKGVAQVKLEYGEVARHILHGKKEFFDTSSPNAVSQVPLTCFDYLIPFSPAADHKYKCDCFLAHQWGQAINGVYPEHETVKAIGKKMEEAGLKVWLDQNDLNRGLDILTAINQGFVQCRFVCFFITKGYLDRVNNRDSNAAKEFMATTKRKTLAYCFACVLESEMVLTKNWPNGPVFMTFPQEFIHDFSDSKTWPEKISDIQKLMETVKRAEGSKVTKELNAAVNDRENFSRNSLNAEGAGRDIPGRRSTVERMGSVDAIQSEELEKRFEDFRKEADQKYSERLDKRVEIQREIVRLKLERVKTGGDRDRDFKQEIEMHKVVLEELEASLEFDFEGLDWNGTPEDAEIKMKQLLANDDPEKKDEVQRKLDQWNNLLRSYEDYMAIENAKSKN